MLHFQGVKHIQCQPPGQDIPPGFNMQSNGLAAWGKLTADFATKEFSVLQMNAVNCSNKTTSCSVNGLCGCCLRALLLNMSLMGPWHKIELMALILRCDSYLQALSDEF